MGRSFCLEPQDIRNIVEGWQDDSGVSVGERPIGLLLPVDLGAET